MTCFSDACQDFGLIISLKKTQVMGQDVDSPLAISINDHELDVIHDFVYLGSAILDTLSLDKELNRRIGKAATTMTRLTKKAWNNSKLTEHTKIQSLRREHPPVWQQVMNIACPTRAKAQCFSHATHSEYHLAGQGPKQHCPGKSWMHQHVHAAAHGRRIDSQRPPLRRTCAGKTSHRQTTAVIQMCARGT